MTEIYTHPTIRSQTHDWLMQRLQETRDRRLVVALQYESARKTKLQQLSYTLSAQWEKQRDSCDNKLQKIDEELDKLERGISKMIEIAHKLSLTEEG